MTTPLSEELREKIASELYARFWARNGVSEPPPWPNQAEAICDMWRSIASDAALSLLPVGWVGESGSSCVAEPGTVCPDAAEGPHAAGLKPCPFCGSDDLESCANAVDCQNCGGGVCLEWESGMGGDEAVAAWNTRAMTAAAPDAPEGMQEGGE